MMKLHDFQLKAYNELRLGYKHGHKHQLLMSPTGSGKCLGKGTPVMLSSGKIVPVEDIKVGDRLMGPDGTPRTVISLARGEEMLYRVNQYYGKDYVVNESHILSLKTIDGRLKNMSVTEYLEAARAGNKEVLSGWKSLVNKNENLSYQIALTKEGVGEYFGFEITGKDRLFLLGDFTVTHNTVCALHLAKSAIANGKRVVFVADRITLINQTIERAYQFGIEDVGAIQADHPLRKPDALFQVASSQTLARRDWPQNIGLIVIDECFTGDVEVLTEKGFVRFDNLTEDLKCAQFDKGAISFVKPTAYIKNHREGKMIRLYSDSLCDLTMTPGHELLLKSDGKWKKQAVESAPLNWPWKMQAAGLAVGNDCDGKLTPIERFAIALQADGSVHNRSYAKNSYSFSFVKQRKIDRFMSIMSDGGFSCSEVKDNGRRRRFLVHDMPHISKDVSKSFDLSKIGSAKAKAIIEEMVNWDGHIVSDSMWYYSSVSKECADFYQCVATLAGYKSRITIQVDDRSENFSNVYRLFIQIKTSEFGTQRVKRNTVYHNGNVYCIRVPSGNIIVRRNGKPVVIGNCHSRGKAWINYLKENPDVAAIGLSATPYTKGLGKMFTNLVCADTMANLTKNGYLVPLEIYTCKQPDLSDEHLDFTGEWKESHVEKEELKIVGDVIEEWKRKANGLKTIVFGRTILYCNELVERFNREGIFAAAFTNQTNKKERESLVRSFKDGQLRVLVSVEALAKGFDETSVECIIDARPMRKSLSTVQQMWGRGVRAHPGKTKCILLDFSGNVYRFWPDFERIYHNGLDKLDDGVKLDTEARQTKKDDEEHRSCPKCGFQPFAKICMECGYEKQKAKSDVKEEEGDLKPITIVVNGSKNKVKKEEVYLQLCKYAKDKGMKIGWAYYQYINMAKEDPKREWNIGLEDRIKEVQVGDAVLHFLRVKELRKMYAMANAGRRK